jgi:hypothetical protein
MQAKISVQCNSLQNKQTLGPYSIPKLSINGTLVLPRPPWSGESEQVWLLKNFVHEIHGSYEIKEQAQ